MNLRALVGVRAKRWLPLSVCLVVYLWLLLIQHYGWFARHELLGTPYLARCSTMDRAYHCTSDTPSLKVINLPITLKAKRDYRITILGRSFADEPAKIYVDFFAPGYDSPDRRGRITLYAGVAQTQVLQWSSGMPPVKALLRIASDDTADYEITSVTMTRCAKWLSMLRNTALLLVVALLLYQCWGMRLDLLAMPSWLKTKDWISRKELGTPALLAASIAVLLLLRVSTLGAPMVFGDEMSYALLATSLGDPTVYTHNSILHPLPNQLFFDVYHFATLCGDAMLSCARALNSLLFALAAFPLFAISRRFLPTRQAILLTGVILLLPNNAYTAFFMPESFYFFAFYLVVWAFITFLGRDGHNWHAAATGFFLAVLSLIKPHGLVIVLTCSLTLLVTLCTSRAERRRIALGWCVLITVFALSRFVLGISAAPSNDTPWFDQMFGLYASLMKNMLDFTYDPQIIARLKVATINNLGTLLLLFGPAILAIGCWLTRPRRKVEQDEDVTLDRLNLFALITLICLLIGTIKFTASIAGLDPTQDPNRLHERYYNFIFGLLLICGWVNVRAMSQQAHSNVARSSILLVPIGGIALWYMANVFGDTPASSVDHPVFFTVWTVQNWGIGFLALLLLSSLLLFPFRMVLASRIYAICILLICGIGFQAVWSEQADSQTLQATDRAILTLKSLYTPAQLKHGAIVGDSNAPLFRAAFYLRNNAVIRTLASGSVIDTTQLAADTQWLLIFGRYRIAESWGSKLELTDQATLYRHVIPTSTAQE